MTFSAFAGELLALALALALGVVVVELLHAAMVLASPTASTAAVTVRNFIFIPAFYLASSTSGLRSFATLYRIMVGATDVL
ncbi:MAG: hypothetical protein WCJ42_01890 [Actinomycetes bacterium]